MKIRTPAPIQPDQTVMNAPSFGIFDPLINIPDMIAAHIAPAVAPATVRAVLYRAPAIAESSGRAREITSAGRIATNRPIPVPPTNPIEMKADSVCRNTINPPNQVEINAAEICSAVRVPNRRANLSASAAEIMRAMGTGVIANAMPIESRPNPYPTMSGLDE
nr:hypothetical protein [Rhodococcus globerulus]